MVSACNQHKSKTPDEWNEKELQYWYIKGKWKHGWDVRPDETVNQKVFARLYYENQERWIKAFQFLSEQNRKVRTGRRRFICVR